MNDNGVNLLDVQNLRTVFDTRQGELCVVDNVSFSVKKNECFGIIGESGCGKSMTSISIMGYAASIGARITGGNVFFESEDILMMTKRQRNGLRGAKISIIMQNPMTALNPLYTVGEQIEETIRHHLRTSRKEARRQTLEIFRFLGIPEDRIKSYPFQLSGGMLQRIAGGIAISSKPRLIIADEPTTALDATVQIQFLSLLKRIQKELGTAIILISHDIRTIAMMCSNVAVMYAGRIVEKADISSIMENPHHPYTMALIRSANIKAEKMDVFPTIEGQPPLAFHVDSLCRFRQRCKFRDKKCAIEPPPKITRSDGHFIECWRAG
jgi:oligopeptide/dipeptide ABC transporter ATP-binding protein